MIKPTYPTAYHVERSMFDKLLLDHVAQSGCHVLQGDHVTDFAFDTDGVTIHTVDNRFRASNLIPSPRGC